MLLLWFKRLLQQALTRYDSAIKVYRLSPQHDGAGRQDRALSRYDKLARRAVGSHQTKEPGLSLSGRPSQRVLQRCIPVFNGEPFASNRDTSGPTHRLRRGWSSQPMKPSVWQISGTSVPQPTERRRGKALARTVASPIDLIRSGAYRISIGSSTSCHDVPYPCPIQHCFPIAPNENPMKWVKQLCCILTRFRVAKVKDKRSPVGRSPRIIHVLIHIQCREWLRKEVMMKAIAEMLYKRVLV